MYTKQHYIDTARIVRAATTPHSRSIVEAQALARSRAVLHASFANLFAADNPRFDRARFEAAVFDGEVIERPGCTPRPL